MINIRDNIPQLLQTDSIGCELGVFEGNFAETLLSSNKFKKLYLVDLFNGSASNFGKHYNDASQLHEFVENKFKDNNEVSVIKQDSINFLESSNINFDFIYIDTVHSYDHLIRELRAAYIKIKIGGYICGHDYCLEFNGVIQAVNEFIKQHGYKLILTKENNFPSFIIQITHK